MQEKSELSILLDYYGSLLTKTRLEILTLSIDEDFSLAEIAEMKNISRQGVRDAICRAEASLYDMEDKLGFVKRDMQISRLIAELTAKLEENNLADDSIKETVKNLKKMMEG